MNLVLTVAIGANYESIAELTTPTMKAYANRIGAEFKCIRQQRIAQSYPYWEKFAINELLSCYDRIIYLDVDTIVRRDCPNMFDMVPENEIGMYNEGLLTTDTEKAEQLRVMQFVHKDYGRAFPETWDGRFFNTGVMVVSRADGELFKKPHHEMFANYWDEAYLNLILLERDAVSKVFDIGYKFNRMPYVDTKVKEPRTSSYIIHYAGVQNLAPMVRQDLSTWSERTA